MNPPPPPHHPLNATTDARTRILRAVEDQIGNKAEHAKAPKRPAELRERLDTPEFRADLRTRTPADLARLQAAAAAAQRPSRPPLFGHHLPPRPDNDFSDMPTAIQATLNPTRFRCK